jgi:hypothetical protein
VQARRLWAAAAAAALLVAGLVITLSVHGSAAGVPAPPVYAPYFEAYLPGSLGNAVTQSGVRYVTLAFAAVAGTGHRSACKLTWNGSSAEPIAKGEYLAAIDQLRGLGGDAIVSFGGASADTFGREIADACHSVKAITAAYEQVIKVYKVNRLDMDIEANSLNDWAGINRRDEAIARLESWAAARHIPLWIQFTLGVYPTGFTSNTLSILRNAVRHHTKINSINLMVFDYYQANEKKPLNMGALGIRAARAVHRQLERIYPNLSSTQIWQRLGFTILPGIDDYPGKTEVTHLSDAQAMLNFAEAQHMDFLSIWSLQRDNGSCLGLTDSSTCSGIRQHRWAFSHLLESFSG